MPFFKIKDKAAAYGLGYVPGEVLEIPDEGITAACLVPEVTKDQKGNMVNTGRQVMATKQYTSDYLIDQGVVVPANKEEIEAYKALVAKEQAEASGSEEASAAPEKGKKKGKVLDE